MDGRLFLLCRSLFFLRGESSDEVGLLATNGQTGGLQALLEFCNGEFGQIFAVVAVVVLVVEAKATWLVNFDKGHFTALNSVSNDGDQAELHHGSVGVKQHRLWDDDVEVVAVEGHAKVAVAVLDSRRAMTCSSLPSTTLTTLKLYFRVFPAMG